MIKHLITLHMRYRFIVDEIEGISVICFFKKRASCIIKNVDVEN